MDLDDLVLTAQALAQMSDQDVAELAGDPLRAFANNVLAMIQDYERADAMGRRLALEVGRLRASHQPSNGVVHAHSSS